jgi:hypothetical protein
VLLVHPHELVDAPQLRHDDERCSEHRRPNSELDQPPPRQDNPDQTRDGDQSERHPVTGEHRTMIDDPDPLPADALGRLSWRIGLVGLDTAPVADPGSGSVGEFEMAHDEVGREWVLMT